MPKRDIVFATNEIYHVYNRSIAKEQIFSTRIHLKKVLEILEFYRLPQRLSLSKFNQLPKELKEQYILELKNKSLLIDIYAYSIMPNHFHFLIKQLIDNGISRFMSNFQNSYAKYYNLKNDRDGALFKNQFKGKWIESDEQFLHISRYIHLNPVTAFMIPIDQLEKYPWTSFPMYIDIHKGSFINTDYIMSMFPNKDEYKKFVLNQADFQKNLALIKRGIIDE